MNLGERLAAWAADEPTVKAVVLIGSRVRSEADHVWRADAQSDWDFQIIASNPEVFANAVWTKGLNCDLKAYAVRRAAIGDVPKAAALFANAEADFVILPARALSAARLAVKFGLHRRSKSLQRRLQSLAVVVRPGWRFLKGGPEWDPFYRQVVRDIVDPRLDDAAVERLVDSFICDMVWTSRKIHRGELLAAQRMLHQSLAEKNYQLLHELRLRRGERSFPEIRRAEVTLSEAELAMITVSASPDRSSLRSGLEKAVATCRQLAAAMGSNLRHWPEI